mgnify:CR=1 FL=1
MHPFKILVQMLGWIGTAVKSTCERYGVHGIPEFYLDSSMNPEDLAKIQFPVMVKPVDNGGGVGFALEAETGVIHIKLAIFIETGEH